MTPSNDETQQAAGEQSGLKVAGYKPTQPGWAVDAVNTNKHIEELILRKMDELRSDERVDQRWLQTARTQIEKGFMSFNRAIFQPQRIAGPLSVASVEVVGH